MQDVCLVHYHELGLKGHNRSSFERSLINSIKKALTGGGSAFAEVEVKHISGRELVYCPDRACALAAAEVIRKLPGVAKVSIGVKVERELSHINQAAAAELAAAEPFATFKVAARRANTDFHLNSMELNQQVGEYLCEHFPDKGVRMKSPDATLHVEVIQGSAYVYAKVVAGIGGLPAGTAGTVVALLSAGFDSPVAAYRMLKRGAKVVGLHFSGAPETPDTSTPQVQAIARVLDGYGGLSQVYTVEFGGYQRRIALDCPEKLRIILYRRLMFLVGEALARRLGAKALVTGESLGQVASQTLDNIYATSSVVRMPIFRPLIGSDKQEIINEALAIGTYELSAAPAEDCCTLFMPRAPETHAKLAQVDAEWAKLPVAIWVDEILAAL